MVVAQNCWLWYMDGWFLQTLVFPLIPNAYMAIANDFSQQLVYLVEKDLTKTMSWKSHKSFSRGPLFSHWLWGGEIGSAAAVMQIIFWPLSSRLQCNFNFWSARQFGNWVITWTEADWVADTTRTLRMPRICQRNCHGLELLFSTHFQVVCRHTQGLYATWQHMCWMWCLSSYMILYAQCDCCIGKSWTCNWKIPKSRWFVIDSLEQLPFGLGTEVAEWRWLAHLGFTARLNGWTTIDPMTIPTLDMLNMLTRCKLSYGGRIDLDLRLARELVHVLVVSVAGCVSLHLDSPSPHGKWALAESGPQERTKRSRNTKGLRHSQTDFIQV